MVAAVALGWLVADGGANSGGPGAAEFVGTLVTVGQASPFGA